jgi:hypothetical protein
MQGHVQRPEVGLILSSEARDFRSFVFQFDGFSARVWGQAHQLNQLYGICGCTPLVHDPGRQGPPGTADTDPPTIPGKPTGSSPSAGAISINWTASTDASPPITYRIYRDGNPTVIGFGTSTSFTDTGLIPGSQHTYTIDAVDGVNNPPSLSSPASDQITVATPSVIFSDSFASGNFSNWTSVTRLTIDNGSGGVAPPSARAAVNAQIAFAYKNLPSTLSAICMSTKVNVPSLDPSATTLLRLRTSANGPIVRVFANPSGILYVRSDASSTQIWSGVALGTGWHSLKLCGTVGISGTWNLYRDAVKIVNGWTANTGTTPVGRVDIGNAQTFTATVNFDDVVIDPARELGATGRQDRLTKARPRPRARAVHPAPAPNSSTSSSPRLRARGPDRRVLELPTEPQLGRAIVFDPSHG